MSTDDKIVVIHDCGDDTCPRFGQTIHENVAYVLITEVPGELPLIQASEDVDKAAALIGSAVAMLPSIERARYDIEDEDEPEDETEEKPN